MMKAFFKRHLLVLSQHSMPLVIVIIAVVCMLVLAFVVEHFIKNNSIELLIVSFGEARGSIIG